MGLNHVTSSIGDLGVVSGLVALCAIATHVASLVELLATLPALRLRPVPWPVVMLLVYWVGLLGWLAAVLVRGAD